MAGRSEGEKASKKTLVVYSGQIEMGWNVCTWIPYARKRSRRYPETTIYCEKGHGYLYQDFAKTIHEFKPKKGKRDRWLFNGKDIKVPKKVKAKHKGAKFISPTKNKCMSNKREYFKYGDVLSGPFDYDVLIHARSVKQNDWIDRVCGGSRNYPMKLWPDAIPFLARVASIGTKKGAYHIPGTKDYRGIYMHDLCNYLANAKVVVGTSSGPMHLAHLCGTPIVVFSDARMQKYIGGSNKVRYKKKWRAWKDVPVKVLEHPRWKPKVEDVVNAVRRYL